MTTMRMRMITAAALVAALAVALAAPRAGAQSCTYTTLASRAAVGTNLEEAFFSYTQILHYWSVVAVSPNEYNDWEGYVYQSQAPYPTCVNNLLAGSIQTGTMVDFVVGDFNHNPTGTYYFAARLFSGTGFAGVEWDATSGLLQMNAPPISVSTGSDFARIWDVNLEAGKTYTFTFAPSGGASLKMLLFRNTGGGTYWAARSYAMFEVTSSTTYTAPTSGYYGLVVVNDNALAGSYQIGVGGCATPAALVSGTAATVNTVVDYHSFDQQARYWTAVGVRGSDDWDLDVWGSGSGGSYPQCFTNLLANSLGFPPYVDFVVGDFNYNSTGTYYVRSRIMDLGTGSGTVEWDGGADQLAMNGPKVSHLSGPDDVLQIWDVFLTAGVNYSFMFQRPTTAATRLLLFRNPVGGTYWTGRGGAEFTMDGTPGELAYRQYIPPATGWYGVVVVNDDGGTGYYDVAVTTCTGALTLAANTVTTVPYRWQDFQFTQTLGDWSVVGVRADTPPTNWQIGVWTSRSADCVLYNGLAIGELQPPKMDFVIGDFNHNPPGTYVAQAWMDWNMPQFGNGLVFWDPTEGTLGVNAPLTDHAVGPGDFLRVWDVYLQAGTAYRITFQPGSPGNHLLLFCNMLSRTYWGRRQDAVLELSGSADYTAPVSGYYGVVVVSDDGASGTYSLGIGTCTAPTALTAGVVTNTVYALNYYSIHQTADYWTAVGVRGTSDWDLGVYGIASGSVYPACFGGPLLANSVVRPPRADFVIGDFNHNTNGTYYVEPYLYLYRGSGSGSVEWTASGNILNPGGSAMRGTGSGDVLECWDTWLLPGHAYRFVLTHAGSADLKLCLFRNPSATYWAGRTSAQLETSSSATYNTPAGSAMYYGLVAVNDNGASDTYTVQVQDLGSVDVQAAGPPEVTRLAGVGPNPARGRVQIRFALHEPGTVRFEVLDMAGRRVATLPEREWNAGTWTAAWDAAGDDGGHLRPGLYFVRMWSGDRRIGSARITLLE